MKKLIIVFLFFSSHVLRDVSKNLNIVNKDNEITPDNDQRADKNCQIVEEQVKGWLDTTEKSVAYESTFLRTDGCVWNLKKGWHKP